MHFICTTELRLEMAAASHINDLEGIRAEVEAELSGLVLAESERDDAVQALEGVPELNYVLPVEVECVAVLQEIAETAVKYVETKLRRSASVNIRVKRRGKHSFDSVEVSAAVAGLMRREVNLQAADYVLRIEIVRQRVFMGLEEVGEISGASRPSATRFTSKIGIIQLLYADDRETVTENMGVQIGRAAQAFSVRELILAHVGAVDAGDLGAFCRGACKGRDTRFNKVRQIRGESTREVPIKVGDLYQTVRNLGDVPIIATSAQGEPVSACGDQIRHLLADSSRLYVLIGSRSGVPRGTFRFADLVLNLAPGLTFSTEQGIAAAVTGLLTSLEPGDL
jgi:tRNA acetyltransferase TAN1